MEDNPIKQLGMLGQSVWLDYICRDLINSGELKRFMDEDGIKGVTSNPSIFEKALASTDDYDNDIQAMILEGKDVNAIYENLSQQDVRHAADELRNVYAKTEGKEGYVSLEVNPHLAHDTLGTIEEARRLWLLLNRPNVFIKVPATLEGLPAIQKLIGEGINVNVTMLFGITRYRQVVEAYLSGIEEWNIQQKTKKAPSSVASLFISRIDALVDPMLENYMIKEGEKAELAKSLHGQIAIASAAAAYHVYKEVFTEPRFLALSKKGAHPQRLLWASLTTKNPKYSDIKYVEALIGRDTIGTIPVETLDAYRKHGRPEDRIEQEFTITKGMLEQLSLLDINIDKVTQQLENEVVDKFNKSFDKIIATLSVAVKK